MSDNNDNVTTIVFDETDDPSDELGYTEYDWDNLSEKEIEEHDRIIEMDAEDALKLDTVDLTDLQKWAAAQVLLEDDHAKGHALVAELLHSKELHPAVDYVSIGAEMLFDAVLEGELKRARNYLAALHDLCEPDDTLPLEFEALLLYAEGEKDAAMERYQELIDEYGDDPELLLDLASHMALFDLVDRADELLEQAENVARMNNDQELVEVITEAREALRNSEDDE